MKKAIPILVVALLGLGMCSAAVARKITGHVYFDTAKTKPARCSDVYLWTGQGCGKKEEALDMTSVDAAGYYEFTGLSTGLYYSVMAEWGFVLCGQCDTTGTECNTSVESDCDFTPNDYSDALIDFVFDIDCECEGD